MSRADNHGTIGHHNYPQRGKNKVVSSHHLTGCEILDKLGISIGQGDKGREVCLSCELPECLLDKKKERGPKGDRK